MNDIPGWIEHLYSRGDASHALHTGFLLNITYDFITDVVEAHADGRSQLRQNALNRLESSADNEIALSLIFLAVVGHAEDASNVSALLHHPSELVQKAAKGCVFALNRPGRKDSS